MRIPVMIPKNPVHRPFLVTVRCYFTARRAGTQDRFTNLMIPFEASGMTTAEARAKALVKCQADGWEVANHRLTIPC